MAVEAGWSMINDLFVAELERIFGPEIVLPLPVQSLTWGEYEEFLELKGILDVQLIAQGATAEDKKRFPARTSRPDSIKFLPWVKASNNFNELLRKDGKKAGSAKPSILTLKVEIRCSQAGLHTLIKSIYKREARIETKNFLEMLRVSDYLQADWMFNPLLAHIHKNVLASHPTAVFELGQHFHKVELCEEAVKLCIEKGTAALGSLWSCADRSGEEDRLKCMTILADNISLGEILRVVFEEKASLQPCLTGCEISMLLNKYPGMEDILASLQNLSSSDEPSHQEQAQHQKLALIAVSEREEKEDLKWGPTLAWIVSKKDLEGKVERDQLKSPATLSHGDGGSFGLLLHKSKGKWGIYVNSLGATTWKASYTGRICCRTGKRGLLRHNATYITGAAAADMLAESADGLTAYGHHGLCSQYFDDKNCHLEGQGDAISICITLEIRR